MSKTKNLRIKSTAYKNLLRILDDYWISQPNEEYVEINMFFKHGDGSVQRKRITWTNPDL